MLAHVAPPSCVLHTSRMSGPPTITPLRPSVNRTWPPEGTVPAFCQLSPSVALQITDIKPRTGLVPDQ
jgi:hypothetical protein